MPRQAFGLWPTSAFWKNPQTSGARTWKLLTVGGSVLFGILLNRLLDLGLPLVFVIGGVWAVLMLGVYEKLARRRIDKPRQGPASGKVGEV
jgi:hypothetical protein